MKKQLLLLLLTFTTLSSFAQLTFEPGYYVTEAGQRHDCLIKNVDWKNNPITFEYKTSATAEPSVETIKNVKEFGVTNLAKFIKATVDIDKSNVNTSDLSRDKNPIYSNETQFLRVLVEGNYNLYEYANGNSKKFFYNRQDGDIMPLVHKRYLGGVNLSQILTNNTYQQQLLNDLKCSSITSKDVEKVDYNRTELQRFFINYNSCNNSETTYVQTKPARNKFDINIRPRINSSTLKFHDQNVDYYDSKFDNKIEFGIGLEFEFYLPYNNNKWSVIVEPLYHTYKASSRTGRLMNYTAQVNYNSIEIPAGLRHYFYLNSSSKIFIDAAYVFSITNDATYELIRDDLRDTKTLDIAPSGNLAIGGGYKYNEKFSVELRFQSRSILNQYVVYDTRFNQLSLILGYTIL